MFCGSDNIMWNIPTLCLNVRNIPQNIMTPLGAPNKFSLPNVGSSKNKGMKGKGGGNLKYNELH